MYTLFFFLENGVIRSFWWQRPYLPLSPGFNLEQSVCNGEEGVVHASWTRSLGSRCLHYVWLLWCCYRCVCVSVGDEHATGSFAVVRWRGGNWMSLGGVTVVFFQPPATATRWGADKSARNKWENADGNQGGGAKVGREQTNAGWNGYTGN